VKPLQLGAVAARSHMISLTDTPADSIEENMMRFLLALGLFVTLCASANAATVHRSKHRDHLRPGQHVTVPNGYAVPGWTDEETRKWLYNGSSASGLG